MKDEAENATEYLFEWAAIMEFDGGLKRYEAEYFAIVAMWRFCQLTGAVEPTALNYKMVSLKFTGDEPREPAER